MLKGSQHDQIIIYVKSQIQSVNCLTVKTTLYITFHIVTLHIITLPIITFDKIYISKFYIDFKFM